MTELITLIDTDGVLDPEDHPALIAALDRGGDFLWSCHNWIIVDANGGQVATRVDLAKMRDRADRRLTAEAA